MRTLRDVVVCRIVVIYESIGLSVYAGVLYLCLEIHPTMMSCISYGFYDLQHSAQVLHTVCILHTEECACGSTCMCKTKCSPLDGNTCTSARVKVAQ